MLSIGILIAFIDLKKNRIENFLYLQALDLIRGKSVLCLMDSSLEGQYENDDATKMVELASKCLQSEARDRPDAKFLLTAVAPLQKQKEVIMSFFFAPYLESAIYVLCSYGPDNFSREERIHSAFYKVLIVIFCFSRWLHMF